MATHTEKSPSVGCVMESIKILVSPDQGPTGLSEAQDQATRFDSTLSSNIEQLHTTLKNDARYESLLRLVQDLELSFQSDEIRFKFALKSLRLIKCLKIAMVEAMKEFSQSQGKNDEDGQSAPRPGGRSQSRVRQDDVAPPLSPDTLSIAQQKTLATALQFVVCLGVCPNLLPGVGIPLERRSGFGKLLKTSQGDKDTLSEKTTKLYMVLDILLDCVQQPSLGSQILSKHLGDMLSGLIQICYGPRPKLCATTKHSNITTGTSLLSTENDQQNSNAATNCNREGKHVTDGEMTRESEGQVEIPSSTEMSPKMYEQCRSQLHRLLEKVYQPLVVRELLVLQGGSGGVRGVKGQMPLSWLRKVCGQLLSGRLMRPGGVEAVLKGFLAGGLPATGMSQESVEWKKCEAVSRLIATCPQHCTSKEDYYRFICPQILDLLNSKDKLMAPAFLRVASVAMAAVVSQHPLLAEKYLLDPLLQPLLVTIRVSDQDRDDPVIVEESSLTRCIVNVHKVFVLGSEPGSRLVVSLSPVIHPLFQLLCFTRRGVSHLRSRVEDLLVTFLKAADTESGCRHLWHISIPGQTSDLPAMRSSLQFAPGPAGGAVVLKPTSNVQLPSLTDPETEDNMAASCMCDLLEKLEADEIPGNFFISVLKELTAIMSSNHEIAPRTGGDEGGALLEIEEREAAMQAQAARGMAILQLLGAMCERLGPSVLRSTEHVVQFVAATLQRGCELQLEGACPRQTGLDTDETLCLAMGLTAAVMGGAMEVKEEDKEHFEMLLPWLEQLRSRHANPVVQEMAEDLLIAIRTHCALVMDMLDSSVKNLAQKAAQAAERKKERPPETNSEHTASKASMDVKDTTGNQTTMSNENIDVKSTRQTKENKAKVVTVPENTNYDEALALVKHPLVPMRGHGLIALSSLVENKDSKAMAEKERLLKLFEENLNHEDSYIYLSSIRGLAALGSLFPEVVIPEICEQFANFRQEGKKQRPAEDRMKLGEILTKVTRSLGSFLPHYSLPLLTALLCGARDPDTHVRASSLANLGEVCHLLRFSLGPIIHEIFACLSGVLGSDPEATVRSAALTVVTQLLRGLGSDATKVLDNVLRDLYRLLKHTARVEKDDTTKTHVYIALEELDTIMKDFLFPKQTLEKKITVLP
ncbi:transport and Golgi organization protein 6 homolog [Branchiostoma lanceolatum]|uniref:transport and Golgi organization protein 6 homolog n=1 Tax=Branchiostoma lanceolatum TaxID=7740 RepID=UPI00345696E8